MRKLTYDELVERRLDPATAIAERRFPVALVLPDIRSMYNVGSIFRSADAFRAACLVLTGFTPTPPRKEISKTALGADLTVPWEYYATAPEALAILAARGYHVCALELTNRSVPIRNLPIATEQSPLALVLGNELTGIPDSLLELCHSSAEIPMFGAKHSLNVAVAAGIALYAATENIGNHRQ